MNGALVTALFAIGSSLVIGLLLRRAHNSWREVHELERSLKLRDMERKMAEEEAPSEKEVLVREVSHAVKNDTMVVRSGLRHLSRSADPMQALAEAVHGVERR